MLLPLLLVACVGRDGTWLLTATLKEDSSSEDPPIGSTVDLTGLLSYLSDGSAAFALGGSVLPGVIEGLDFKFQDSSGESYEGFEGCDLYSYTSSTTLEGSFTADQGLEGSVRVSQVTTFENCEYAGGEGQEAKVVYDVVGLRLDADPDAHPMGALSWGYLPGGGY